MPKGGGSPVPAVSLILSVLWVATTLARSGLARVALPGRARVWGMGSDHQLPFPPHTLPPAPGLLRPSWNFLGHFSRPTVTTPQICAGFQSESSFPGMDRLLWIEECKRSPRGGFIYLFVVNITFLSIFGFLFSKKASFPPSRLPVGWYTRNSTILPVNELFFK